MYSDSSDSSDSHSGELLPEPTPTVWEGPFFRLFSARRVDLGTLFENMVHLDLSRFYLTEFEMSLPVVKKVGLSDNQLEKFRLIAPKLEALYLSRNRLSEFELGDWPSLKELWIDDNSFTRLSMSHSGMTGLRCDRNQISEVNLDLPALNVFSCHENPVRELNVNFPRVSSFVSSKGRFEKIPLLPNVEELEIHSNPELKVFPGDFPKAKKINVTKSGLKSVTVRFPKAWQVNFHKNDLSEFVYLDENVVEIIDLDKNPRLSIVEGDFPRLVWVCLEVTNVSYVRGEYTKKADPPKPARTVPYEVRAVVSALPLPIAEEVIPELEI